MKIALRVLIIVTLVSVSAFSTAQSGPSAKKHLLVIGEEKGYRHDSVSHAMATIQRLGWETGLWDTTLRTDTEVLTKKKLEYNAKNLKDYSRDKVRVLMRLDVSKLDMKNKNVHRTDGDFAVTWAKMYGKGRVYYTTLGHVDANWNKPEFQQMITEAIKWAMGLENAELTSRPLPAN